MVGLAKLNDLLVDCCSVMVDVYLKIFYQFNDCLSEFFMLSGSVS